MKFSATASDFIRALNFVGSVVEKRTTIVTLQHVLVQAEGTRVKITGTDLERECIADAAADVEQPGDALISASVLKDIVSRLPKAATMIVETTKEGEVTLSFSRNRYRVQTLDAAEFPLAKIAEGAQFSIDAKAFSAILEATIGSVSTEGTRYYLCGVFLHVLNGALVAVSTDGHRLCRRSMDTPANAEHIPGVIVPTKSVNILLSMLGAAEGEVSMWLTASRMWIETPHARFSTALINGEFPDYQRVIPQYNGACATFDGADFYASVDRASRVDPEALAVVAGVKVTPDGMVIRVGKHGADAAVEHLDVEVHSESPEIGANSQYLAEMTKIWGGSPIDMHVADPSSPIVFTSKALPEQLYIIMPSRL